MEDQFYRLPPDRRIALVREAIERGRPLMIRWAQLPNDFGDRWQGRAAVAARLLAQAVSIADLGCGTMNLERFLRADQRYLPVDLVKRDERTLVLDFNDMHDLAALPKTQACAILGVFEYTYRAKDLIAALQRRYDQVVASFNILGDDESFSARLAHGWVNHFSREQFLELFSQHGFTLTDEALIEGRRSEVVFNFQSQT